MDRNDSKIKIKVWLTKQFILRNSSCSSVCLFHYQSVGIMFQILQFTVDSFVLKQQTKRAIIGNTLGANSGSVWRMLCVSTSKVASWRKSLRATLALTQPWRILSRRRNCCLIFSTYWHSTGAMIICLICKSRHSIVTLSTHCYFLKSNKTTLKSLISI